MSLTSFNLNIKQTSIIIINFNNRITSNNFLITLFRNIRNIHQRLFSILKQKSSQFFRLFRRNRIHPSIIMFFNLMTFKLRKQNIIRNLIFSKQNQASSISINSMTRHRFKRRRRILFMYYRSQRIRTSNF